MKYLSIAVISVLFLIPFSACKQEKSCPAFNMNDLAAFTYKEPDTISFENEADGLFQVFISQINFSLSYTYECRDLHKICPCTNYAEALATDTKTPVPYSFLRMEQSDVSEMQYFKYNIQGFEFEFDFINELPYIDQMDHLKYYDSYTIGGAVYEDVIAFTNMNVDNTNILKVFFNKQNGVLQFIEKSTNSTWRIKE